MRRMNLFAALAIAALVAGCHANGQQPPSTPVYSCPTATVGGNAYTEANQPSSTAPASITGTSYDWSPPSVGTWCMIVQSWAVPTGSPSGTPYQVSNPSNVLMLTTTASLSHINASWTAPATNSTYTSYTYIFSYAPATQAAVPLAPPLNGTTASAMLAKPPAGAQQLATNIPGAVVLKAERVR